MDQKLVFEVLPHFSFIFIGHGFLLSSLNLFFCGIKWGPIKLIVVQHPSDFPINDEMWDWGQVLIPTPPPKSFFCLFFRQQVGHKCNGSSISFKRYQCLYISCTYILFKLLQLLYNIFLLFFAGKLLKKLVSEIVGHYDKYRIISNLKH